MGIINNTFVEDSYIQLPNLKDLCKENGIKFELNKRDFVNAVEKFGSENTENKTIVLKWAFETIKAGTKDLCYRKIYRIDKKHKNFDSMKKIINDAYPNCPQESLFKYQNTKNTELINFEIYTNGSGEIDKISFIFSGLVFEGERNTEANKSVVYPIFVDLYMKEGFIVTRQKPKSKIYAITESNLLLSENHIDTTKHATRIMDELMKNLEFNYDLKNLDAKNKVYQMQFKLYEKYTVTPNEILDQIELLNKDINEFVKNIFDYLDLSFTQYENAIQDLLIFAEKYIAISGDNEEYFKKNNEAYLIKVVSDDELDKTKVDTSSSALYPLQCTEAFYDSKKAIIKSKQCDKLNLCFKRKNKKHFHEESIVFQFLCNSNFGGGGGGGGNQICALC